MECRLGPWLSLLAATGSPVTAQVAVLCEWDLGASLEGWTLGNVRPVERRDGLQAFETDGDDPILISPAIALDPRFGDVVEVTLLTPHDGAVEWFWRSSLEGPYAGFSPEAMRTVPVRGAGQPRTYATRLGWRADRPIINLRLDLPHRAGRYAIGAIRVVRLTPAAPRPARFEFPRDAAGWQGFSGADAGPVDDGLGLRCDGPEARLVSPALEPPGAAARWLVIDATVPPADLPDGILPAVVEVAALDSEPGLQQALRLPCGGRATVNLRLESIPADGPLVLSLGLPAGEVPIVLHRLALAAAPELAAAPNGTGTAIQTVAYRREYRLPVSPRRIDIAREAPPATRPVASDYDVAMWYFTAWEPEYTWDGWQQVAERSPWRLPLLFDSSDLAMQYSGIQFYRASHPRVVDWHMHWMREHGVSVLLWDWYPQVAADGTFDATFFANRALETGFLGKETIGGPPVTTNRFADTMRFALMWTNHPPFDKPSPAVGAYLVEQFFRQPNYYRVDDRPLLPIWSVAGLVGQAGGREQARALLDDVRARAVAAGLPGVWIASVGDPGRELHDALGLDGVMAYHYPLTGGDRPEPRRVGERVVSDRIEDYPSQTIPGHQATWDAAADAYGRGYLLATTPQQNWEPTLRPTNLVMTRQTPDAYRELLFRAKRTIEARGLRRFVSLEAWNEWLEGSYAEPSTQWGFGYLEAIRDVFGQPPP